MPRRYGFAAKWRFVLWSLARQRERLAEFGALVRGLVEPFPSAPVRATLPA